MQGQVSSPVPPRNGNLGPAFVDQARTPRPAPVMQQRPASGAATASTACVATGNGSAI